VSWDKGRQRNGKDPVNDGLMDVWMGIDESNGPMCGLEAHIGEGSSDSSPLCEGSHERVCGASPRSGAREDGRGLGKRGGAMVTATVGSAVDVRRERNRRAIVGPWLLAPALAGGLAVIAALLHLQGVDMPAQLYRVGLFQRQGLVLWDSQWYGGHFTFDYSIIFPPLAGIAGVLPTTTASAAAAAASFDHLVANHFGARSRMGSVVFAISTLVPVVIGQLPFLLGEAFALAALAFALRGRWRLALVLALACSLASPLAGAFLILGAVTWLITSWPRHRLAVSAIVLAAALPVVVTALLFPGQGAMPFPSIDFLAEGAIFVAVAIAIPREQRAIRIGTALYLLAFGVAFVVHSPLGGNIERLGETLGAPLVLVAVWPARRSVVVTAIVVALMGVQWGPAITTLVVAHDNLSTQASYYAPMVDYITAHDNPPGRVEVVPTALHWEAAYVAPVLPLARGWERQLDTADNPIFYTKGELTTSTYLSWLINNGVRFVSLPGVALDYSATVEADLIRRGVPGLKLVWQNSNWSVFAVEEATGIVSGPAREVTLSGGEITLQATRAGVVTIRERYSPLWTVTLGKACTGPASGGWLAIRALAAGPIRAQVQLVGPPGDPC
jgi:hypothetical protein